MSLRGRIAVTAAVAVVLAVMLVGALVLVATVRQTRRDLDDELLRSAELVRDAVADGRGGLDGPLRDAGERRFGRDRLRSRLPPGAVERLLGPLGGSVVQVVGEDLSVRTFGDAELPVDATTGRLAVGEPPLEPWWRDIEVEGRAVRTVALPVDGGGAVQVGALADRSAPALTALRRQLVVAGVLGAGLAAVFGMLVAGGAVRPVRRLTETAEAVGRTGDLTPRIPVDGDDELARLAASFNRMLASLDEARAAQRQLVADASHELRTPLTSLRTNIDVLAMADVLPDDDRGALLRDVTAQLEELGRLIDGLVELARGDRPAVAPTRIALGGLVGDVIDRLTVFHPAVRMMLDTDGSVVLAERDRLDRAVANMVDNAVKHGGGRPVDVVVRDGRVVVRDHGPGIDEADLPHVFDRFYRAPSARSRPGSGLGLSIVAQVADAHDGAVDAANHPDGGAVVTLTLPVS